MTKQIPLTRGLFALVDDVDYEWLSQYKWHAAKVDSRMYARRVIQQHLRKTTVSMHREIVNASKGVLVDHWNGKTLDNRRGNLRECSQSQNQMNQKRHSDNTSGYKGVHWSKENRNWVVRISANKKRLHIGCFSDVEEAARAYDKAAQKFYGEFALLNFPDENIEDKNG